MCLLFFSILLPTAPQAILTTISVLTYLFCKGWKDVWSKSSPKPGIQSVGLNILLWFLVMSLGIHLLSFGIDLSQADADSQSAVIKNHLRLIGKQGLWGFFLISFMSWVTLRGFRLASIQKPLCCMVAFLVAYMLIQRYTGIDFVQGFDAKISDERYSDGVYRVAGFIAHPLTFGFNSGMFVILCLGIGLLGKYENIKPKLWLLTSALGFVCLLLSQSRAPLVFTMLAAVVLLSRQAKIRQISLGKKLLALVIVTGSAAFFVQNRMSELWAQDRPLVEAIPRVAFLDVHWQMFVDHPLTGVGYSKRVDTALEYYESMGYTNLERKYSAHNIYVQTLADSGLLGALGLVLKIAGVFVVGVFLLQISNSWLLLSLLLYGLISGLTQNTMRDSEFMYAFWFCFGIVLNSIWEKKFATRSQIENLKSGTDRTHRQKDV